MRCRRTLPTFQAHWLRQLHAPKGLTFHLVSLICPLFLIRVTRDAGAYPRSHWAEAGTHTPWRGHKGRHNWNHRFFCLINKTVQVPVFSQSLFILRAVFTCGLEINIFYESSLHRDCVRDERLETFARSHHCVRAQKEPPEFREESQSASFIPALQTTNSPTHKQTHKHIPAYTHILLADGPSLQVPGAPPPQKKTYICLKTRSPSDCNT